MNKYELPNLPYGHNALEPVLSQKLMEFHHDKHHAAYVNGANAAAEKLDKSRKGELHIDLKAVLKDLSFNVNGHVLHSMFWENIKAPEENNRPGGSIGDAITKSFGSFEAFQKEFSAAAKTTEGSGWASLCADEKGQLHVMQIEKHNSLNVINWKALLVLDVWEHAYYLDYQNNRGGFVDSWWKLVNWSDVEKRL